MQTEGVTDIPQKTDLMKLTENGSYTFATTKSKCFDFYFDVMQSTDESIVKTKLSESWDEDALLTLKLVFHLRDIRHGKAAFTEFHQCLLWLFDHHPQTLIYNLQFITEKGYWKDLSYLIKFILTRHISKTTPRQTKTYGSNVPINIDEPVEEIIRRRVSGEVSKESWVNYLGQLPSDDARKECKAKFQLLANQIHQEAKNNAKAESKLAKINAETRIANAKASLPNFVQVYNTIVDLFVSALKHDKELLLKEKHLPSTALVGKWSPTIDCSIDIATQLGKNIAKALLPKTDEGDSLDFLNHKH